MKQVVLIRMDLKLPKGKACTQVGHACVEAVLRSDKKVVKEWRSKGMAKVVLKVKDLKELRRYIQMAKDLGLVVALITDAGRTVVAPGTVTCGAIGPYKDEVIDKVTSFLKLM